MQHKYTQILTEEFNRRKNRNTAYSLRSFARDLKISPTSLSLIFSGKQGLSAKQADNIAKNLSFSKSESEHFIALVNQIHARSKLERESATKKLEKNPHTDLSLEYFKIISDWQHLAIMQMVDLHNFESDPKWIAKQLNITTSLACESIERLCTLELLNKNSKGELTKPRGFMATPIGTSNKAIQNFHQQMIQKAEESITNLPTNKRDLGTSTFTMNEDDWNWACDEIRKFRHELTNRLTQSKNKNLLVAFSTQFFPLNKPEIKKPKKQENK